MLATKVSSRTSAPCAAGPGADERDGRAPCPDRGREIEGRDDQHRAERMHQQEHRRQLDLVEGVEVARDVARAEVAELQPRVPQRFVHRRAVHHPAIERPHQRRGIDAVVDRVALLDTAGQRISNVTLAGAVQTNQLEVARPYRRAVAGDGAVVPAAGVPGQPRPDAEVPAPVRFLADFDNLTLSHADRTRVAEPEKRQRWMGRNGGVGNTVFVFADAA